MSNIRQRLTRGPMYQSITGVVNIQRLLVRVVHVRMYQTGTYTAPGGIDPYELAMEVTPLYPSLVQTVLRIKNGETIGAQERSDYDNFRNAVLAANPNCKFSLMFNAQQFSTLSDLQTMINSLGNLNYDIASFDFLSDEVANNPTLWQQKAGDYMHSLGKLYTGHIWNANYIPDNIDYITTDDMHYHLSSTGTPSDFILRAGLMQGLASARPGMPILIEVNNNPQNGSVYTNLDYEFIDVWTTGDRLDYITTRAEEQAQFAVPFKFAYPILFPTYPDGVAYSAENDDSMLANIGILMRQYNTNPPTIPISVTASDIADTYGRWWDVYVDGLNVIHQAKTTGESVSTFVRLDVGSHTLVLTISQTGGTSYGTYGGTITLGNTNVDFNGVDGYHEWQQPFNVLAGGGITYGTGGTVQYELLTNQRKRPMLALLQGSRFRLLNRSPLR